MEKWTEKGKMARGILRGLLAAYLVTAVFLFVLAFVMLKLHPDAQKTGAAILACYVLSCLIGGWVCGRTAARRKFLWGLAAGTLYFLLLFLVSGMGEQTVPVQPMQMVTAWILCAGGGMAGGMIAS